jgi:WD40 repeat protein
MRTPMSRLLLAAGLVLTVPCSSRLDAEEKEERPRTDVYGDPLPEGVVARLGSVRFRHPGAVREVAFSPDGKRIAASSDGQNMVVIWDRATGRKLREIPAAGKYHPPTHLRFSPDGKRLYALDETLAIWDVETGAHPKDAPNPPAKAQVLGYSADGRETILLDKKIEVVRWDIEKGKELGRYPRPDGDIDHAAQVGERLLVSQFDNRAVTVWDVVEKKRLWSVEATRQKEYPGLPMAFSLDGKLFAVEAPPKVISVYDSVTGKLVRRLEADVREIYWSVCFSPDKRTVVGSNWDASLRLWDLESGREQAKIPAIGGTTTYAYFAPDSKTFATGGPNNAHGVLLWETATGKRIEPYPGHSSPIASVSFAPDGRTAATSSRIRDDSIIRLWDLQTGRLLRTFEATSGRGVAGVAFSPDGATLAATCNWYGDLKVRLWDVGTGRERHALAGHETAVNCVAFSPDGKRLATGDAYHNPRGQYEGRLCVWDVEAGKLLREIRGTRGAIQRVLFTRDGRQIVAAADGVHVYDADTGQLIGEPFPPRSRIWGLSLSADRRLLATADGNGPPRLWELATRREIPLAIGMTKSYHVDLTPDGRVLAANGPNDTVQLYDWRLGEVVGKLSANATPHGGVWFAPDGRRLATATDSDSAVLVWDVSGMVNRPLPGVGKPGEADLRRWWEDLRDDNPGTAYRAVWRFAAAPEQGLPFLAASLPPVKIPDPAVVARLIEGLDSPEFEVRETSSQKLEQLGEPVVEALRRKAADGKPTPEQAQRIKELLATLAPPVPGGVHLRATRAVAVLEQIGSPEARKVLVSLAAGAPGAALTREAKASLQRLGQKE